MRRLETDPRVFPAPATPLRTTLTRLSRSTPLVKLAGGVLVLGTWEIVVRLFAPAYVARPSGILRALPQTLVSEGMLRSAGVTLWAVIEGLVIAVVSGTVIGLSMGRVKVVDRLLRLYVNGLYAMPMVAILPLLTIWFGYSSAARLATVVFAAFFPIAMNASDGARSVPVEYLEVARACRARWTDVWFGITLPSSLPYLLAGVRLAIGRALVGAVVAEFFISIDGLGYFILFQSRTFHHDAAFVAVLLLAGFAVGVDGLIGWVTRSRLRWYRPADNPV
jgi:ABC-type nitrate/sulfonate/bicarbonate transport system permease component